MIEGGFRQVRPNPAVQLFSNASLVVSGEMFDEGSPPIVLLKTFAVHKNCEHSWPDV